MFGAHNPAISIADRGEGIKLKDMPMADRPISVYPVATRQKLVDLMLGVGVFFAATVVLNRRQRLIPVLVSLTLVGVAISFFGILQKLSFNGKIFWQYELLAGGVPFASFVNSNNAAGFLLICFSAAMFFVAYQIRLWSQRSEPEDLVLASASWEHEIRERRGILEQMLNAVAQMQSKHLYFLAALAIIVAGIMTSLSRGGMLALACSTGVGCLVIARANRVVGVLATIAILVGGFAIVQYADQTQGVSKELESLANLSDAASVRLNHWSDAVAFAGDNLVLGCGNGTYRYISPSFQTFLSARTFAHAESVYVETLVEMGVGGIVLLLACVGLCARACLSLYRRRDPFDRSLGIAGLICLTGQVVAAALDFGIYQPANMVAMAAFMGGVVGRSYRASARQMSDSKIKKHSQTRPASSQYLMVASLAVVTTVTIWAVYDSYGIESRESAIRTIKLFDKLNKDGARIPASVDLDKAQQQLQVATKIRPDDSDTKYYIGELEVMRYRVAQVEVVERELDQQLDQLESEWQTIQAGESNAAVVARREQIKTQQDSIRQFESSQIWTSTGVLAAHQELRLAQRSDPELAIKLLESPAVKHRLTAAWESFAEAEQLCDRLPKTQYRLAQLAALVQKDGGVDGAGAAAERLPTEADRLSIVLQRSYANTQLMFSCGFLALSSGDQDRAVELWAKCLRNPHLQAHERAIVEVSLNELPMRLFFERVLPQDPKVLIGIATKYLNSPDLRLPKQFLVIHTKRVIEQNTESGTLNRHSLMAQASMLQEDYSAAAENFAAAETLGLASGTWRYDYANALYHSRKYDDAIRQLKICQLENLIHPGKVKYLLNKIRSERMKQVPVSRTLPAYR